MKSATKLFAIAAALVVLGVAVLLVGEALRGDAPEIECVPEGTPSSGFADEETGCPISVESYNALREYESGPFPHRIAMLVLIVAGVGTGVAGGVVALRGDKGSG